MPHRPGKGERERGEIIVRRLKNDYSIRMRLKKLLLQLGITFYSRRRREKSSFNSRTGFRRETMHTERIKRRKKKRKRAPLEAEERKRSYSILQLDRKGKIHLFYKKRRTWVSEGRLSMHRGRSTSKEIPLPRENGEKSHTRPENGG